MLVRSLCGTFLLLLALVLSQPTPAGAQHRVLDDSVVTGTLVPTAVRALPAPITIITAADLAAQDYPRLDQLFRGQVPGAVAWDPGPDDRVSTVQVRSASSLAGVAEGFKIYIDGVELINPTYLTLIDTHDIERIELVRGPEAATLHGAGALNGVLNIITRHSGGGGVRPSISGTASVAAVAGTLGADHALRTSNALGISAGGERAGFHLGGAVGHVGEWTPDLGATTWGVSGGSQMRVGPVSVRGSARYAADDMDYPIATSLRQFLPTLPPTLVPDIRDRARQQTYALTASVQVLPAWRHTLTVGYDQTRSLVRSHTLGPTPTSPDSSLSVAEDRWTSWSLLYHTDLAVHIAPPVTATVTAGVNYVDGRWHSVDTLHGAEGAVIQTREASVELPVTGYFGQVQVGVLDRVFVTAGLRADDFNGSFLGNFPFKFKRAWTRRAGVSYVLPVPVVTVKIRAAYGEAIRGPTFEPTGFSAQLLAGGLFLGANDSLRHERQRGVDGGVDVYLGDWLSFGATYYNQRTVDLFNLLPSFIGTGGGTLANSDAIRSHGWEFEGRFVRGPVSATATWSIASSIVDSLGPWYAELYQLGDRVLEVPRTTAGATVTYTPFHGTTVGGSVTRIANWVALDQFGLYEAFLGRGPFPTSVRDFWVRYPSVTKFSLAASQRLGRGLVAFVRAENVGNNGRAERGNLLPVTPRSVTVGVRLR